MSRWPERYLKLVVAWLEEQWNEPSRTDYYLMRISQRIQQQYAGKKQISVDDQRLSFKTVKKGPVDLIARSKAIWRGRLNISQ